MELKQWGIARLWMIMLVLSMPILSADALAASVQIVHNAGEDDVAGYFDANGDVWRVQAVIGDVPADPSGTVNVAPEDMQITLEGNSDTFDSCSQSPLGWVCEYLSNLGGVTEAKYTFDVKYLPTGNSDSDFITGDGSAPTININKFEQNDEAQLELDFSVREGDSGVGISRIEVVDSDSGNILHSETFTDRILTYDYSDATNGLINVPSFLTGEGQKRVKVRAYDRLGHVYTSPSSSDMADFIVPKVIGSLQFSIGEFIGPFNTKSKLQVTIEESSGLSEVLAFSDQMEFVNPKGACFQNATVLSYWHCSWDAKISPESDVSVNLQMRDTFGNTANVPIDKRFTSDQSPPEVYSFGSDSVYDGQSYVTNGETKIVLKLQEAGVGMERAGIVAHLGSLSSSAGALIPDACAYEGNIFICNWTVSASVSGQDARISLTKMKDKVGNEGILPIEHLIVDTLPPVIEDMQIKGVGIDGVHDFFQSGDKLLVRMEVRETSGLNLVIDLSNVVNDLDEEIFTEQSCTKDVNWICEFLTESSLKSGPQENAKITLQLEDTAGNEASYPAVDQMEGTGGIYKFRKLGLENDPNPDYWELSGTRELVPFVDLDVARTGYFTMPVELKLRGEGVKALEVKLVGCRAIEGPELSRYRLFGGYSADGDANPRPKVMLEFAPFDPGQYFNLEEGFKEGKGRYECIMRINTRKGRLAISAPEVETAEFEVPFAFSTLGSLDENVDAKVNELMENDLFQASSAVAVLNDVFKWVGWVGNIGGTIVTFTQLLDVFSATFKATADGTPDFADLGWDQALRGACFGGQAAEQTSYEWVEYIQIPLSIFNCNPGVFADPGNVDKDGNAVEFQTTDAGDLEAVAGKTDPSDIGGFDVGWYAWWQRGVLNVYNIASGRILFMPATSLYENLYTSAIGLCIPGIVHNLNKAREIYCRKIVCYKQEVPSGIATFAACDALYDQLMCEYFFGPLFDFVGIGGLQEIGKMLSQLFGSVLGVAKWSEILVCSLLCFDPTPGAFTACKIPTVTNKIISIVNSIVGAVDNRPDVTSSPYCDQVNELLEGSPVAAEEGAAVPETAAPETAAPAAAAPASPPATAET